MTSTATRFDWTTPTPKPVPRLLGLFLRMEWFRSVSTGRFTSERLMHSAGGVPHYYAGHRGTIASVVLAFRSSGEGARSRSAERAALSTWEDYERSFERRKRIYRVGITYLSPQPHERTGHLRVDLIMDTRTEQGPRPKLGRWKRCRRGVHICVLVAWVGPLGMTPEGNIDDFWIDGCHKNGNPRDNRLKNLVWGDRTMNAQQREEHARQRAGQSEAQVALVLTSEVQVLDRDLRDARALESTEEIPF